MNWLDWTPKASNIEKGCPQALPKPPKPTEEPTLGGFGSAGVAAFFINKGSGSPSDGHDGLSPTSENVDRSQQAPESLIPVLTRLKPEVADLLRDEDRARLCVCPECQAEFATPNACADHMRFECPLWCPDCNQFIVRNGVCPGCGPKHLKPIIAHRSENFHRLKSRFNLESVSWKRMREITNGQPWQVLPTMRRKSGLPRRAFKRGRCAEVTDPKAGEGRWHTNNSAR